jgi:hypothetical protein
VVGQPCARGHEGLFDGQVPVTRRLVHVKAIKQCVLIPDAGTDSESTQQHPSSIESCRRLIHRLSRIGNAKMQVMESNRGRRLIT